MLYTANFYGRLLGAIGILYRITDTVEAENEEQARIELYKKYDSVRDLKLTPIEEIQE